MATSIDYGSTLESAMRYSVIIADWDTDIEEYVSSDHGIRDMWANNARFATQEAAMTALHEHDVDAAWIVDEITGRDELVFPS